MKSRYPVLGRLSLLICCCLLSVGVSATNTQPPPQTSTPPPTSNTNANSANAGALAAAGAVAGASSDANAGAFAAQGQQQGQGQGQQQGQITHQGQTNDQAQLNDQSQGQANRQGVAVNTTNSYPRQVPAIVQMAGMVVDCGSSVGANGAGVNGAGALGMSWTTGDCYALRSGVNFAAIGEYEAACVLWKDVNRTAFKRQKYQPDCVVIAARLFEESKRAREMSTVTQTVPVDLSKYPTREEMDEKLDRRFKKSVAK